MAFRDDEKQASENLRPDWAYSPSPMIWSADPDYAQQKHEIDSLLNNPPEHYSAIKPNTIAAMEKNVWGSDTHQKIKNAESLAILDPATYQDDAVLEAIIAHTKAGRAYPAEVLHLMSQTNLSSAELARLTHPYGARDRFLEDMYSDVHEALKTAGASFDAAGLNNTRVSFFDHDRSTDHGILTAKNDIARLDDITITERRSFAFQTDFESFPIEVRSRMNQVGPLPWDARSGREFEEWKLAVFRNSGLLGHVRRSLSEAPLPDHIIPVSTVIYAHRQK